MVDPITGRPVYEGLPVPWVARWSAEIDRKPPIRAAYIAGRLRIGYTTPDPVDNPFGLEAGFRAQRDEWGVLWYRDRPDRQDMGEPQFGQIQALRQRACMMDRRCQVCGRAFGADEPVTFLLGGHARHGRSPRGPIETDQPPCCPTCIPVALSLCPAQRRKDRVVVRAYRYEPHSVLAAVYRQKAGALALVPGERVWVRLGDSVLAHSLGMMLRVRITDYEEVQVSGSAPDRPAIDHP